MARIRVETRTHKTFDQFKEALDGLLGSAFPGVLQCRWEESVLRLTAPGARGQVDLRDGTIAAQVDLSPPASLMKGMILQKMTSILEKLGDGTVDVVEP